MPENGKTFICVYDALCGWCYGFGPVLLRLEEKYGHLMRFEIISGGMITGKSVGPLANMAGFISQAYPVVEQHSGIKFGQGFLENLKNGTAVFSSLEPGNVLTVLKEMAPNEQVRAAHEIQCLIYDAGINPVDYPAYRPVFENRGLDWNLALSRLKSAETSQLTVHEFSQVHSWGIRGFPASLLDSGGNKLQGIANGFLPFEELESRLLKYI